jgi:Arc/MetJ-type ribon-helix-helix transcriptional regulator
MIMKIITVNLPVSYLKTIEGLIGDAGLYPSRSELIRVAIREFLMHELETAQVFTTLKPTVDSSMKPPEIDQSLFVRVPVAHAENLEDIAYKTYRIVKK